MKAEKQVLLIILFSLIITGLAFSQPILVVNPLSSNLGDVLVGSSATQTVTITNEGNSILTVSPFSFSQGSGEWSLSGFTGGTIAPSGTETFDVTFTPVDAGAELAKIDVLSDGGAWTTSYMATGLPQPGELVVSPLSSNLGDVLVGSSATQTVAVTNEGTGDLTVSPLSFSEGSSEWSLSGFSGGLIAPSGSETFEVTFTPVDAGAELAKIDVISDFGAFTTSYRGTGRVPPGQLVVSPLTFHLGQVVVGTSASQTITVTNEGIGALTVSSISFSEGSSEWSLSGFSGGTIAPSGSETFDVTFTPANSGFELARVDVISDFGAFTVRCEGEGVVEPEIDVSPLTPNLGQVEVGGNASQTITIANLGSADLTVSNISISEASNEWSLNGFSGGTIAPSGSETFDVIFTPIDRGAETATIDIVSNDPDEITVTVTCSAEGVVPPDISAEPDRVQFGRVKIGAKVERTFTLRNNGGEDLIITAGQLAGSNGNEFEILDLTFPLTIRPGQEVTVTVRFGPQSPAEKKSGQIKLTSNDPDEVPFPVPFNGEAVASPNIAAEPRTLNFGDQEVGLEADLNVVVSNPGTADLNVSTTNLIGIDENQWQVKNGAPFTVAPGASHNVIISFLPTTEGAKKATVVISSDALNEDPIEILLLGSGVITNAPEITIDPSGVDFGDVQVGTASKDTILIMNDGNLDLEIASIDIVGLDSGDFSVTSGNHPVTLSPNDFHEVIISFQPSSNGAKTAALEIQSNDANESLIEVALTGTGFGGPEPDIVTVDTLDFGDVQVGTASNFSILIINEGTLDLVVSATIVTGLDSAQFSIGAGVAPFTIAPDDTEEVTLSFQPATNGNKSASLIIQSNDPDENPHEIKLLGTGIGGIPAISTNITTLDFGDVEVTEAAKLGIPFRNVGTADLLVSQAVVVGSDSSDFVVTAGEVPSTLAPGDSSEITIDFQPSSIGVKSAVLQIISNDHDGSPLEIALGGNGTVTALVEKTVTFGEQSGTDFNGVTTDAYLDGRKTDFNTGTTQLLRVGNNIAPEERPYRTLIKFDFLPGLTKLGITEGSQIVDARLEMSVFRVTGTEEGVHVDAFRVNRDWQEGSTDYDPAVTGEVTFNSAKHQIQRWAMAGAAGVPSDREGTADDTQFINSEGQKVVWNVTSSVQFIVANNENFGWLLKVQDESKVEHWRLYSSEHRKQALRPRLIVIANAPSALAKVTASGQHDVSEGDTRSEDAKLTLESDTGLPTKFSLAQNYPNPFNPETQIRYELPISGVVTLTIFDIRGKEVARLADRVEMPAGAFVLVWGGRDASGKLVASGTYIYRMLVQPLNDDNGPIVQARKMILLK